MSHYNMNGLKWLLGTRMQDQGVEDQGVQKKNGKCSEGKTVHFNNTIYQFVHWFSDTYLLPTIDQELDQVLKYNKNNTLIDAR